MREAHGTHPPCPALLLQLVDEIINYAAQYVSNYGIGTSSEEGARRRWGSRRGGCAPENLCYDRDVSGKVQEWPKARQFYFVISATYRKKLIASKIFRAVDRKSA